MSELFAWVPWFQELAQRIAADGAESLIARTKEIPWNKDGAESRLLQYGDQNVDPLSFFYVLASKNGTTRVYSAITEVFDLTVQVNFEGGFYYPTPQARAKLLFHSGGRGNTDLLWRLFRSAVTGLDSIKGHEFDEALSIKNVGPSKLTEALFLINPGEFLPFDKQSLIPLQKRLGRDHHVSNWETYRREIGAVRGLFPGCEPYEIQHFAYDVFGVKEKLDVTNGEIWQSLTPSDGTTRERAWDGFRRNGWIRHERDKLHDLRQVARGDLVFVHDGHASGYGIGVVYRNDYTKGWSASGRLHVLWLHTETSPLSGITRGTRFSRGAAVMQKFRDAPAYKATLEMVEALRRGGEAPSPGRDQRPTPPDPPARPDLRALADATLMDESELQEIWRLLEDKRQIIFQGPPGTGKTYVAQKLAACLAGDDHRVRLVQFHPSHAYEDFVQGFRPTLKGGQAGFELRDGPLLRMAELARDSDEKHFLIIDEINRGNLSKILGELYFLLEYRDEAIQLQYSDESFSLPKNLYLIGTMNTADRSIALVDLALRRRFHFVEFHPDKAPIGGLLNRWLERNSLGKMSWVARVLDSANAELKDHHAALGPSYFMPQDKKLSEERVRRIWEHNVMPYIEERLFGQEDVRKRFGLKRLRKVAGGQPPPPQGDKAEDGSGTG